MRLISIVAVYILCVGCGSSSPVSPTPVTPNLSGLWNGTYAVLSCNETGTAAGFCDGVGRGGSHVFTATSGASGTLGIGIYSIPVTGNLDRGVLTLTGQGFILQNIQLSLNTWRATVAGSTMNGTMTYTAISTVPPIGAGTVSASFTLAR